VLSNLVGNAIQHSPDGSRIRITVTRDGHAAARLEVWNEGPPIEMGTKLFEPFERGTDSGGGLGLGLYIAHEVMFAHGGTLSVRSDEAGTTFTMRLPLNSSLSTRDVGTVT
jgi:phosphoserine phosphatase RsbU/P